jgi:hypothetical protein
MTHLMQTEGNEPFTTNAIIRWIVGGLISCLLAIGGAWASGIGATVNDHEKRIIVQEQTSLKNGEKLDEILKEVKELRKSNAR